METDPDACLARYASADGKVVNGSCMSALPASSLPAAAANRSAASRTVEEPFDDDHWVLDTGTHFDMCPSTTPGIRTKRNDLGTIITASGPAFPDHTITTCIDAIGEKAECVPIEGLSVKLLSVGRRCRIHGARFAWEPFAEVPEYASPEGALIPVECYGDTFVPAIRSIVRQPKEDDDDCGVPRVCLQSVSAVPPKRWATPAKLTT